MIISKPNPNTLFSLSVFILLMAAATGWAVIALVSSVPVWYHYVVLVVCAGLMLGLLARITLGYQIISSGKDRVEIRYPFRFRKFTYLLSETEYWEETTVNTRQKLFKQLTIRFKSGKTIRISNQEHTQYQEMVKYFQKKASRKRRTSS